MMGHNMEEIKNSLFAESWDHFLQKIMQHINVKYLVPMLSAHICMYLNMMMITILLLQTACDDSSRGSCVSGYQLSLYIL